MTETELHNLMLLYSAGVADAGEVRRAEAALGVISTGDDGDVDGQGSVDLNVDGRAEVNVSLNSNPFDNAHDRDNADSNIGRIEIDPAELQSAAERALLEAELLLATMAASVEAVAPPANIRERLLVRVVGQIQTANDLTIDSHGQKSDSRVAETRVNESNSKSAHPTHPAHPTATAVAGSISSSTRYFRSAVAVAAVLLLALLASLYANFHLFNQRQSADARVAQLKAQVGVADELLASPTVHLVKFESDKSPAYGRVLYCPSLNLYSVHVYQMTQPPPGRVYELWLITPEGQKLPAGIMTMGANGDGFVIADAPHGVKVDKAAITDEPTGGSESPTGSIHLLSDLSAS